METQEINQKEYVINLKVGVEDDIKRLKEFLLKNFKTDNFHFYCLDAWAAYSGQIGLIQELDDEAKAEEEERVTNLKDKHDEEALRKFGVHSLGGNTIEEQVDSIISYINSGLCIYLSVFNAGPGGSLGTISLAINIIGADEDEPGYDGSEGEEIVI